MKIFKQYLRDLNAADISYTLDGTLQYGQHTQMEYVEFHGKLNMYMIQNDRKNAIPNSKFQSLLETEVYKINCDQLQVRK